MRVKDVVVKEFGQSGYCFHFTCFRYWNSNWTEDSVSESLYQTTQHRFLRWHHHVSRCDACMGQGLSEHTLRKCTFQQGSQIIHNISTFQLWESCPRRLEYLSMHTPNCHINLFHIPFLTGKSAVERWYGLLYLLN